MRRPRIATFNLRLALVRATITIRRIANYRRLAVPISADTQNHWRRAASITVVFSGVVISQMSCVLV
jgi:hypothetical protein